MNKTLTSTGKEITLTDKEWKFIEACREIGWAKIIDITLKQGEPVDFSYHGKVKLD